MGSVVTVCLLVILVASANGQSFENQALAISRGIQEKHLPFGTILDPIFPSPESTQIVSYTRCGDSAIWTGHYLAAESFRYAVTKSPEALTAARKALQGLKLLVDLTGQDGLLARCALPVDNPLSNDPRNEEKSHGVYHSGDWDWIGDTSRDQYLGIFFGLSVAYDQLPDDRATTRDIGTRLLQRLLDKNWAVVMPTGDISTVFWLRPDQQLTMLQIGRQLNADRFGRAYEDLRRSATGISFPIELETLDTHGSYFKFNLDAISLYNLLRLEEESPRRGDYIALYRTFYSAVRGHGNAFFNVIDRAMVGPNTQRDTEILRGLGQWLLRSPRDFAVDLRSKYKQCGDNQACDPIPVAERVTTDFLWQRSPFQMYGGGSGRIEQAGIDFILPYWMARFYGIDFLPLAVSAASGTGPVSSDSIASLFGAGFPVSGAQVTVTDIQGNSKDAIVYFANTEQINFVVPASLSTGKARVAIRDATGTVVSSTSLDIKAVAPSIFTATANGKGVASAIAFRVETNGSQTNLPVFICAGSLLCTAQRIDVNDDRTYLSLYGTGIRGVSSLGAVRVSVGGVTVPVLYAGIQPTYAGLDQVNVKLPSSLKGKGEVDVVLTADGVAANTVRIAIR